MTKRSPYHDGELTVQARVNESNLARVNGSVISDSIPEGALHFIEQQAMVVIGSLNSQGHVWASILFGQPGFLRAIDVHILEIDLVQAGTLAEDPLWVNLEANANVGLIIIDLGSRQRLRVNGRMRKVSTKCYIMDIEQAYPNCPKYIQRRNLKKADKQIYKPNIPAKHGTLLNSDHKALIVNLDTFFVASAHPEHGVDASHRGGQPGFVQVLNDTLLRIPDYVGNSMFNTLGNFQCYPYTGLVFIDFQDNRLLQLTGKAEILWHLDDPNQETGGTQRYWQFEIAAWQESGIPFAIDWELLDYSPFNPKPLNLQQDIDTTLSLKVEKIQQETARIKSFVLRRHDDEQLPVFQPGAHLPVKVKQTDGQLVLRHYSLLSDPSDRTTYEIAVLAEPEGRGGSLYLHQEIHEDDILQTAAPKNDFPMSEQANHTVLIAGGIGITPILSMLYKLSSHQQSYEIHYTARSKSDLAFLDRIEVLAGDRLYCYTSQEPHTARLDLHKLLASPKAGTHVYVCGPRRMIKAVRDIADSTGWPAAQIHFESFGTKPSKQDHPLHVRLAKSNKSLRVAADQTILDSLLDAGINVSHDCKRGECGKCSTRVLSGEPDHQDFCLNTEERSTSICVCVSRAKGDDIELDL